MTFTTALSFFAITFPLSCVGVEVNRTCPRKYLDTQTGRCKVRIGFIPQTVFAFPTLDNLAILDSKSFAEDVDIYRRFQELYPSGYTFSNDATSGCKSAALPCPTVGIDMDIISKVFNDILDWDFELVAFYTYPSVLYATRIANVDMAWAATSITGRRETCVDCPFASDIANATSANVCCLDYSHRYWEGGLAVTSELVEATSFTEALFTKRMLNVFALFFILLFIAGHIMWIIERNSENGQIYFPKPYTIGASQGIYWACTTATTVGYGDTGPTTFAGKVFTMGWMFIGIVFAGIVSGLMSSALTLKSLAHADITRLEQMNGKTLCYVAGYSEIWLNQQGGGVRTILGSSVADCLLKLEHGNVDGVLFDRPWLVRYSNTQRLADKFGVSENLVVADYGVAFPEGSDLTHKISAGLMHVTSDKKFIDNLKVQWIKEDLEESAGGPTQESIDWGWIGIASALVGWLIIVELAGYVWPRCRHKEKIASKADDAWRTPAFNKMESMFRETLAEIRSDHSDLVSVHDNLALKTDNLQTKLSDFEKTLTSRLA